MLALKMLPNILVIYRYNQSAIYLLIISHYRARGSFNYRISGGKRYLSLFVMHILTQATL